jgi:hypothetical protein
MAQHLDNFQQADFSLGGGFPQQSGDFLHHFHLVIDDFIDLLDGLVLAQLAQLRFWSSWWLKSVMMQAMMPSSSMGKMIWLTSRLFG